MLALQRAVGNAAVTSLLARPRLMRAGMGEVHEAEAKQDAEAREALRGYAATLLGVQLKRDQLAALPVEGNGAEQLRVLTEHIDRVAATIRDAGNSSLVDLSFARTIKVGIDAGGVAADLMYLDQLGAGAQMSTVTRSGVNRGLAWAWKAMRMIEADRFLAGVPAGEAEECIRHAVFHRDMTARTLTAAGVMKAGVTAAQMMDLAVSAPRLLASANTLLQALGKWLTGGGGGGAGVVRAGLAGGVGTLTLVSGGRTLILTAEQIEALVRAGVLSSKALALYMLSKGGTTATAAGPYGARPPGSKSRYTDEELIREYLKDIGRNVPEGERGLEELGVVSRQLQKVEQKHHLLVQQLRRWFKARGVNIDSYTVKLSADEHRWIHNEYKWNELWKEFRLKNPKASPSEILAEMRRLMKEVGLEGLDVVPYR